MMYPGETFADLTAGLRDLTGQNHVSEHTLLSPFYRNRNKTTRILVKSEPASVTIEQAVDRAITIHGPIDNVTQGMINIEQALAKAPSAFSVPTDGTMGSAAIVTGVDIGSRPTADSRCADRNGEQNFTSSTNPQGVYNKYAGTWDVQEDRF
ncbi:hypothetical protein PR003_g15437 [Phytophthora rubi]|uniref:Uncharacterized protein n=1 Tax=Phytophthora rubi TaxID=129364 RepID=A0A6A4F031_9STRA|nr:hypothetical protein PR003_g15437 [Phytophthora rubi]